MDAPEEFSILLVDDDTLVIRVLSRTLTSFAPLRFATSGHVALQLSLKSIPDLVLLDVDMPELSGFEVCRAFKHHPLLGRYRSSSSPATTARSGNSRDCTWALWASSANYRTPPRCAHAGTA
jgi:CheY-like chemotaxis protein